MTRALRAPAGAYRAASASLSGARRRLDRSKPPCNMASDKEFAHERAAHAALPDPCCASPAAPPPQNPPGSSARLSAARHARVVPDRAHFASAARVARQPATAENSRARRTWPMAQRRLLPRVQASLRATPLVRRRDQSSSGERATRAVLRAAPRAPECGACISPFGPMRRTCLRTAMRCVRAIKRCAGDTVRSRNCQRAS